MYAYNKFTSSKYNFVVVTTVQLQKITYHRSSGLITALLSTLKVVHNVTDKNTNKIHPINNSGPIHSSRLTLLGTSMQW